MDHQCHAAAFDLDRIERLVETGYISRQRHPSAPLTIYNYTPRTQFERNWTPETRACRGLVLRDDGSVAARPFEKFFNLHEHDGPLPDEPFDVFEKVDGSLGIAYHDGLRWAIATRGSFVSEQAAVATTLLHDEYAGARDELDPAFTYLFEIVYPENRIVVDYGDVSRLVLLGVVETATGRELDFTAAPDGFEWVARYDGYDNPHELAQQAVPNREGFVVRFRSGLRLKVKFAEYVRLHRILTGLHLRRVWEMLRDGQPFQPLYDGTPAPFQAWLRNAEGDLRAAYQDLEARCLEAYGRETADGCLDRKTLAERFLRCELPAVLFRMLDRKPYDEALWKAVRPLSTKPYRADES